MPALDGLRAFAIIAVLGFHYALADHHFAPAHWVYLAARSGWLGVDLFFVLSGFLITGSLLDTKGSPRFFRNFYVRRTLRIFPLYYATLAVVFGGLAFLPAFDTDGFNRLESEQLWLWVYLTNWVNASGNELRFVSDVFEANHFWSLAMEEQFYLLWPAVVLALSRRWLIGVSLAGFVALSATRALFIPPAPMLQVLRADGLLVGAAIAGALRDPQMARWACRLAVPCFWVTAAIAFGIFALRGGIHEHDWIVRGFALSPLLIMFASAVVAVVQLPESSRLYRILSSRPLGVIARYSYALYVFHWAFNPAFERWIEPILPESPTSIRLINEWAIVLLRAGLAFGLAAASYHFFEVHFLKLKDRWAPSPRRQDLPLASAAPARVPAD